MFRKLAMLALLLVGISGRHVYADAATYDSSWQWNSNVTIKYIYTYWETGFMHVRFSNNEFCYIKGDEDALKAVVLTARAQNATIQVVCSAQSDKSVDGVPSRHVHRIKY